MRKVNDVLTVHLILKRDAENDSVRQDADNNIVVCVEPVVLCSLCAEEYIGDRGPCYEVHKFEEVALGMYSSCDMCDREGTVL